MENLLFLGYAHEVLVNRLGGLSLPRKSVVRLTDRPDMTLDVYRGRKTTIQHIIFRCPKIWAHYSLIIMCLHIGIPNNHHFPTGATGKVVVVGGPILKHFRVSSPIFKFKGVGMNKIACLIL